MKNPEIGTDLSDEITSRYMDFEPHLSHFRDFRDFGDMPFRTDKLADTMLSRHIVEKGAQPGKIADALDFCKEQMLVRDNYRPELFIWDFSFQEDPREFGFLNQTEKNRLTKHRIELIFTKVSELFYEYFSTRVSVANTDLTGFMRKKD